jgi:general secretion pathway protein D
MGGNQGDDTKKSLTKSDSGLMGSSNASGANNNDLPNVKIIADTANNSLIIVATAQEYKVIQNVLKQIDVLPLQVMIDATIVEVTLNDQLKYGIQWYLTHNNGGTNIVTGGSASPPEGINLTDIAKGVTTGGFSYAFSSGSKDINAVLQASATDNNINVISSPSLMVLNNQEASIKVGDSVPIRSSISTNLNNSTPGGIQTSSIQMIDTGIHLAVRPRVNAGGLVSMDILQTVNQAKKTTDISGIDSPTITKREIETSVVVQNGETIALGGLIKESNDYSKFGVPVLHEIPLLGSLFGSTSRNKDKTELVVLLTPRVMKSRQDAQDVTAEFKRKLSGIYVEPTEISN